MAVVRTSATAAGGKPAPPAARRRAPAAAAAAAAPAPADTQAFLESHRDSGASELFGIAELCQEFGVTLRALRFYEDKGLLAPRRVGGVRVYTRRDRARLALILRAKAIGSPLAEIKRYLDLYGDHGEGRAQQLGYVIGRTDAAIAELERKRAQIDETLAELRLINATCRRQLEQRRRGAKSGA